MSNLPLVAADCGHRAAITSLATSFLLCVCMCVVSASDAHQHVEALTDAYGEVFIVDELFYAYTREKAAKVLTQNCDTLSWEGSDVDGTLGRPWLSFINCDSDTSFKQTGVNLDGPVKLVLVHGWLRVGTDNVTTMGEAVWIQMGTLTDLELAGAAYVTGAKFNLVNADEAQVLSTYLAPTTRAYMFSAALIVHDNILNNGTADAQDAGWNSSTTVDPAHAVVAVCEDASVSMHVHPQGAVYMPLAGKLCFVQAGKTTCITTGNGMWVSPLLRYSENFYVTEGSAASQQLAATLGLACDNPIALAVTNFDLFNPAGLPSLTDVPQGDVLVRMTTVKSYVLTAASEE